MKYYILYYTLKHFVSVSWKKKFLELLTIDNGFFNYSMIIDLSTKFNLHIRFNDLMINILKIMCTYLINNEYDISNGITLFVRAL